MNTEQVIFEMWANEGNRRVRAVRLPNGDVRLDTVDLSSGWPGTVSHSVTLASYRADDLATALAPGAGPARETV